MGDKDKKEKGKKSKFDFFQNFIDASEAAVKAAEVMRKTIGDVSSIVNQAEKIHKVENEADVIYHRCVNALNKAFITPIEREDIRAIAGSIDDVVDALDDIVVDLYIYNITTVREDAVEFAKLIVKSVETLKLALIEFKDYKKSRKLHDYIVKINDNEEMGDNLYQLAIRRLFTSGADALEIMRWRSIFEVMEECCDACENVADVIEGVLLKND